MADIKRAYGGANQDLAVTLASLASSSTAGRECTAVDNTANLYTDALVQVWVKTGTGTIAADKALYVYAYATADGASHYTGGCTGTDAAHTMTDPPVLPLLGVIPLLATSTTYGGGPWSVAQAFGGVLPAKWGVVLRNYCGVALTATEGDHDAKYQGVYLTSS